MFTVFMWHHPDEDNEELKETISKILSKRWQEDTFKNSIGNIRAYKAIL